MEYHDHLLGWKILFFKVSKFYIEFLRERLNI